MSVNLSGNSISRVWREGDIIFKRQPKYLADNEEYALVILSHTYHWTMVPRFISRVDDETIAMAYIENEPVTDALLFMRYFDEVLRMIDSAGLRHGDLTEYTVMVNNNMPIIIDWAESRWRSDPRPDKRPGGDDVWLKATMEKLCQH